MTTSGCCVARTFKLDGFQVSEATGAEAALRVIRVDRPEVVVLEPVMWPTDGWHVLSSLQDDPALSGTPVVVLTGKVSLADRTRAWTLGAARFVAKPFSPEALTRACRDAIAETMADRVERQRRKRARLNQQEPSPGLQRAHRPDDHSG